MSLSEKKIAMCRTKYVLSRRMNRAILDECLSNLCQKQECTLFFVSLVMGIVGEGGKTLKNSAFESISRKKWLVF